MAVSKKWSKNRKAHRLLRSGNRGLDVAQLQHALRKRIAARSEFGFRQIKADGDFGANTREAWVQMAKAIGLDHRRCTVGNQELMRNPRKRPAHMKRKEREWERKARKRLHASRGLDTKGGARGMVEDCVRIAAPHGTYVGSDHRPGDRLPSGNWSDHAFNNSQQAARDIGVRGINLLTGPPSPKLDRAVADIGRAFGRNYGNGRRKIIDTFYWNGCRVQIIWRTPAYGGHLGHIHIGIRRV